MMQWPIFSRWVTFVAGAWIQTCAGLFYTFGIYAPLLKASYGLSQTGVQGLGAALLAGGYLALPGGWLYDAAQGHPAGPRLVLWLGAALCMVGYGGLYLLTAAATTPASPAEGAAGASAPPHMTSSGGALRLGAAGAALFVAGMSGNMMDTGVLVTNVRNFPGDKGPAIGLLKALLGLGPSLFTSAYYAGLAPSRLGFLALLALAPPALVVTASVAVNLVPPPPNVSSPAAATVSRRCFGTAYLLVATLALHQLSSALLPGARDGWRAGAGLGVALALLAALGCVAWMGGGGPYHLQGRESPAPSRAATLDSEATCLLDGSGGAALGVEEEGCDLAPSSGRVVTRSTSSSKLGSLQIELPASTPPGSLSRCGSMVGSPRKHRLAVATNPWERPEEVKGGWGGSGGGPGGSLRDCYWSEPFWLLFGVFAVGVGSGLAFSNNLQEVAGALAPLPAEGGGAAGGGTGAGVVLVSLFSVGSCCGRLLFGYLPDRLLLWYGIPRTAHLALVTAAMSSVNLALGLTTAVGALYPLAVLYGVAFGALWCLVPAITSEIFGVEHFASLYTSLILAPALGCWLLAAQLAGRLYDAMSRTGGGQTLLAGGVTGSRSSAAAAEAAAAAVGRGSSSTPGHMRRLAGGTGQAWLPAPRKLAGWLQGSSLNAATSGRAWQMPDHGGGVTLGSGGSHGNSSSSSSSSSSGLLPGSGGWARILCEVVVAVLAAWPGGEVALQGLGADVPLGAAWQDPHQTAQVGLAAGDATVTAAAAAIGGEGYGMGQDTSRSLLLAGGDPAGGEVGPACMGPACFRLTFMLLALLCGGAAVAAGRLVRLTRGVYVAQAAAAAAAGSMGRS